MGEWTAWAGKVGDGPVNFGTPLAGGGSCRSGAGSTPQVTALASSRNVRATCAERANGSATPDTVRANPSRSNSANQVCAFSRDQIAAVVSPTAMPASAQAPRVRSTDQPRQKMRVQPRTVMATAAHWRELGWGYSK